MWRKGDRLFQIALAALTVAMSLVIVTIKIYANDVSLYADTVLASASEEKTLVVEPKMITSTSYYFVLNDNENNEVFGASFEAFFAKHWELRPKFIINNDTGNSGQTVGYTVIVEVLRDRKSSFHVVYKPLGDAPGTDFESLLLAPEACLTKTAKTTFVNPSRFWGNGSTRTIGYFVVFETPDPPRPKYSAP